MSGIPIFWNLESLSRDIREFEPFLKNRKLGAKWGKCFFVFFLLLQFLEWSFDKKINIFFDQFWKIFQNFNKSTVSSKYGHTGCWIQFKMKHRENSASVFIVLISVNQVLLRCQIHRRKTHGDPRVDLPILNKKSHHLWRLQGLKSHTYQLDGLFYKVIIMTLS